MEESIYTPEQVAQILQVHQFTVLKFIRQGKLKASKLGRMYRVRKADLDKFLDDLSTKEAERPEKKPKKVKEEYVDVNQARLMEDHYKINLQVDQN